MFNLQLSFFPSIPFINEDGEWLGGEEGTSARNYGKRVYGPWVFGKTWVGPSHEHETRYFYVAKRDRATLEPLIMRHIAPGSDEWGAYKNLSNVGYEHETVNHSEHIYKDPVTGCHTNGIEGEWSHCKLEIVRRIRGLVNPEKICRPILQLGGGFLCIGNGPVVLMLI